MLEALDIEEERDLAFLKVTPTMAEAMSDKEKERVLVEKLKATEWTDEYCAVENEDGLKDLKKFAKFLPEWLWEKYNIVEFCEETQKKIKEQLAEEEENIKRMEEEEKEEIERQTKELFEFKKSKISTSKNVVEVLPIDGFYHRDAIKQAKEKMEIYLDTWEEAKEYYEDNDLDTEPDLGFDKKEVYADYRKFRLGKEKKSTQILGGNFYRAKDLDEETKNQLLNEGFEHSRGIELDGKICGGGFYYKKNDNESVYHFCMKHLFKELHRKMETEYEIDGMRADVALVTDNFKLAIEIETGNNNKHQLTAKAKWSEIHFDHCVFVCSRKNLNDYKKLLAGYPKITCHTAKNAKEKVEQLLNNYKL